MQPELVDQPSLGLTFGGARSHRWGSYADGTVAEHARRMEAWVPVGSNLKAAFSEMLQHDAGWVAVLDGDRYLGVLTPGSLHEALRRSVEPAPAR